MSMTRSVVTAALLAVAVAIASPGDAQAQGNSHKAAKATTHKPTKRHVTTRRTSSNYYGSRVLCEDGVYVIRTTNACSRRGGIASRQANYPPASDRAREVANENSAVQRGVGANNVRTNAIARCNDGTYWHATTRLHACTDHGGVATWY